MTWPNPGAATRIASDQPFGESKLGSYVDEPFRRIDVVPLGSVPTVPRKDVVVIMVSLSQRNERHPPTVPTGIRPTVGLTSPQMTDGIDAERGVQDQKDPPPRRPA